MTLRESRAQANDTTALKFYLCCRSALLNAGHTVSRSHACAGSLKTNASHRQLHDIFRSWIKLHPVRMENISETSPARRLLSKEILFVFYPFSCKISEADIYWSLLLFQVGSEFHSTSGNDGCSRNYALGAISGASSQLGPREKGFEFK